jgi:hypothetical protein
MPRLTRNDLFCAQARCAVDNQLLRRHFSR